MPQLDFFTFPHQYFVASVCFCGMYYFNLLFLFPWIKYFFLLKIFSINSIFINNFLISKDYLNLVLAVLDEEIKIISLFLRKNKKLQKNFILRRISSIKTVNLTSNNNFLVLYPFASLLFLFFFLKNFLIFNPEKLMLIYFLIISFFLFNFAKVILNDLINKDIKKFISFIVEIEEESNNLSKTLISFLVKLKINVTTSVLENLLIKNLEVKAVKRIKW